MAAIRIVVLVCAVAATCGSAWNVPSIPSGRRTQFYLQKNDGAYQYGYDTGAGHSGQATADASNEVRGNYAYVGGDGRAVAVRYSAGQGGYVPLVDGAAVPAGPPAPAAGYASRLASSNGGVDLNEAAQDPDYDPNADASYSFNIDTDSYKRTEQADARGNVRGQYSYNSASGGSHALSYVAGEGTGFVVTGGSSSAPTAASGRIGAGAAVVAAAAAAPYSGPISNARSSSAADGSYSFGFDTSEQSRQESADAQNNVRGSYSFRAKDDGRLRRVDYQAGAATGFIAQGDHLPVAPEVPVSSAKVSVYPAASAIAAAPYSGPLANIQSSAGNDGSYSFAFGTDLQSRQESADALNNVRGSYTFKAADDGQIRRVDYEAGAATGFIAKGDHLPVAPSVDASISAIPSSRHSIPAPAPVLVTPYSGPISNTQISSGVDGSYSFSFDNNDQSRQESADALNNVRGSYSFKAKDDGKVRRVDYVAGSTTGFVATGDHLPVAPEVPALLAISAYSAPAVSIAPVLPVPVVPYAGAASDAQVSSGVDGSYSFSYNANGQSRQESSDAKNNVRGSFSFIAPDDGQTRRVDYEAGSATGFVATGVHLPVAPAVPVVSAIPAVPEVSSYSVPAVLALPAVPAGPYSGPVSNAQGSTNADGSYAFSFSTDEQSRQESADAQNNVRGSYQFKARDDGVTRRVDYVAGAATGFVASGNHLPKAPPVPSALGGPAVVASRAGSIAAASSASVESADGSYSFSYDAGDHSRQEAADAAGNVRGSFSFVAKDDGKARRVDYSAGRATGFLAKGSHLPVAGDNAGAGAGSASAVATSYSAPSLEAAGAGDASGDASYAYSYQTDSSSKTESSDAQGNVQGEYSYTAADGAKRRVSYTARKDEGFVANGDLGPSGAAGAVAAVAASAASSRSGAAAVLSVHEGNALVNQYLPPQSAQKFGYIYDTKA